MTIAHHADWHVCVCVREREEQRERVCTIVHYANWQLCERNLSVCVFERGRVCVVMSSNCVTTRNSVVRLVTAGWKRCVWVCNVDTGLVDLGRMAT